MRYINVVKAFFLFKDYVHILRFAYIKGLVIHSILLISMDRLVDFRHRYSLALDLRLQLYPMSYLIKKQHELVALI